MQIHYIQPYSTEKNIGKAINEAINRLLPCDGSDWIVLTDHDMLWLLPDSKAQVERILRGTNYDILGCMTNRIRSVEQLVGGRFSEDDRIREHIRIAETCRANAGDHVKPATGVVAAFMLCFQVNLWVRVGGFVEGVLNFDTQFCWEAQKIAEARIGIMAGVYVWHSYRLMSKNPKAECKHLL